MDYVLLAVVSFAGGAIAVFVLILNRHKLLEEKSRSLKILESHLNQTAQVQAGRHRELEQGEAQFRLQRTEFELNRIAYSELQSENALLKSALRTNELQIRQQRLERIRIHEDLASSGKKTNDFGTWFLRENVKWIGSSLNQNNFSNCSQKLQNVISRCRSIGLEISTETERELTVDLKNQFERAVKTALAREEQARIKAQLREELQRERDIKRAMEQTERERIAIETALKRALLEAADQHSEEIERLRSQLADAEARSQRAISQAQLTKSGHVYVISNIGSFGDGVFKIGMTRRLEPLDRIHELGDASVPFPFDVHMMISSDDAPLLERALHHALHKERMNRVNPRREFFRSDIASICQIVEEHHGEVDYVAIPEALQYHQSLTMSDEEQQEMEKVYDKLEDEGVLDPDDEHEEVQVADIPPMQV